MQFVQTTARVTKRGPWASALATSLLLTVASVAGTGQPAEADHSVYFGHITEQLSLDAATRRIVDKIMNQSESDVLAVFAKHGIDPKAKPDFGKLMGARHELQAVERHERRQLIEILTPEQLKIYDKLILRIRARVIKATRNDN